MSDVKRWEHTVVFEGLQISATYMAINDRGEYVMHDDYAALEAELARLRAGQEPDGCMIAPIQPTEEMRKRAQDYLAAEGMIVSDWLVHTVYTEMLAAAPSAPATVQGDALRPLYTCIGKGGEYRYLGTAIGAGDSRGELVEVYQDENGQLYHRTPEDFMERMEPVAAAQEGGKV